AALRVANAVEPGSCRAVLQSWRTGRDQSLLRRAVAGICSGEYRNAVSIRADARLRAGWLSAVQRFAGRADLAGRRDRHCLRALCRLDADAASGFVVLPGIPVSGRGFLST